MLQGGPGSVKSHSGAASPKSAPRWTKPLALFLASIKSFSDKTLVAASPRAFYCTKMCEKSKSTTFSYYKLGCPSSRDILSWPLPHVFRRNFTNGPFRLGGKMLFINIPHFTKGQLSACSCLIADKNWTVTTCVHSEHIVDICHLRCIYVQILKKFTVHSLNNHIGLWFIRNWAALEIERGVWSTFEGQLNKVIIGVSLFLS